MTIQPKESFVVEFLGTPESGKTSLICRLQAELEKVRRTIVVRESAEIVPVGFPKSSLEAHYWMRLNTAKNILEVLVCNKNTNILVDRGIIDTLFWDYYYVRAGRLTREQAYTSSQFLKELGIVSPNLVVLLSTTPEEAVRRRGGEGRIVTKEFITNFNNSLFNFIKEQTFAQNVFHLDTSNITKEEKFTLVYKAILEAMSI